MLARQFEFEGRDLSLYTRELDPAKAGDDACVLQTSTSLEITAVRARDAQASFVAGRACDGAAVVVLWEIKKFAGARSARQPLSKATHGTPIVSEHPVGMIANGTYVPASARPALPRVLRTELRRGEDLAAAPHDLVSDPDWRYVFLLSGERLLQLDLTRLLAVVLSILATDADLPIPTQQPEASLM